MSRSDPPPPRGRDPAAAGASTVDLPDQLRRLGALIAAGDAPLPQDLKPAERRLVLTETARLRRQRLIRWIARAIAWSLPGDAEP